MRRLILLSLLATELQSCREKDDSETVAPSPNEIIGDWELCAKEFDFAGTTAISSVKTSFIFSIDGTFKSSHQYFTDTVCTNVDGPALAYSGRYSLGAQQVVGYTNIDLTYTEGMESGNDQDRFDIYKVVGDQLHFGEQNDTYDGTTAEKRPQKLSEDSVLTKVD